MYFDFVVPASGRREPIRDLLQKEQQDRFPITEVDNDKLSMSYPRFQAGIPPKERSLDSIGGMGLAIISLT
jgi:hypothetical protein